MNQQGILALLAISVALTGQLRAGEDKDKDISIADTSAAVQSAISTAAAGGEVQSVKMEDEDGTMQYEAVIKKGTSKIDATITKDGTLKETEEKIASNDVPTAVMATINSQLQDIKANKIEKVTSGTGDVTYEAVGKKDGAEAECVVAENGTLIKTKQEMDEKKQPDQKD